MSNINYKELLHKLIKIAKEGSRYIRSLALEEEYLRDVREHSFTKDVTRVFDEIAESFIINEIKSLGLNALIVSEESGRLILGKKPEVIFVIDPVDGSINFASRIPWASVSIAMAPYKNNATLNDIIGGVVTNIYTNEVYYFLKGEGCFENHKKVLKRGPPQRVLLGYFESLEAYSIIPKYWSLRGKTKIRSLGSVALDLIYVGLGRVEGFVDVRAKLRNVDISAAYGFARECGAPVTHVDGSSLSDIVITRLDKVNDIIASWDKETHKYLIRAYKLLVQDFR